jgi:Ca2+:H+ antiporter
VLLAVSLLIVIALAKKFGAGIGEVLDRAGAPAAVSGLIVALLVLLPESMAATRAAYRDDLQKSLNLALGSSLATIGLTIPAVAVVAILLRKELVLGLEPKETLLLSLTLVTSVLTFGTGRTNVLPGLIHIVIFAAFVFLTFVP